MGRVKEAFQEKIEESKLKSQEVMVNGKYLQCPTCSGSDVMVGENKSICLECDLIDDTNLFLNKKIT